MRQINFLIVFVFCLALVLFSLQNPEPATIKLIEGYQVQAPLAIELILAMGLGAVLAWVFGVWARLQRLVDARQDLNHIRTLDERIQQLEQEREQYKAQLDTPGRLPPASESAGSEMETSQAMVN
ncbi:MAG: LapA family protein [Desertifilum sp. SIO1I2]|nr:LapA family protein [Desertifilum sp. SIO1I2]